MGAGAKKKWARGVEGVDQQLDRICGAQFCGRQTLLGIRTPAAYGGVVAKNLVAGVAPWRARHASGHTHLLPNVSARCRAAGMAHRSRAHARRGVSTIDTRVRRCCS
eukprot:364300-Chlamydomonas_euryale.AAC.5